MPLALWLEWLLVLPLAAVGVFSLRNAAERRGGPYFAAAWRITGSVFVLFVCCLVTQVAFGTRAFEAGPSSPPMAAYLRWSPALEHGRTLLVMGAAAALCVLGTARTRPGRGFLLSAAALMAFGALLGAAGGRIEGPFRAVVHFTSVAVTDVAELLMLMATLFVLLVSNRVDRYLWSLLAVYASSVALGIFWFGVVAGIDSASWHPPLWTLSIVRLVLYGTMALIAFFRWRADRRGGRMRGMLGADRLDLQAAD